MNDDAIIRGIELVLQLYKDDNREQSRVNLVLAMNKRKDKKNFLTATFERITNKNPLKRFSRLLGAQLTEADITEDFKKKALNWFKRYTALGPGIVQAPNGNWLKIPSLEEVRSNVQYRNSAQDKNIILLREVNVFVSPSAYQEAIQKIPLVTPFHEQYGNLSMTLNLRREPPETPREPPETPVQLVSNLRREPPETPVRLVSNLRREPPETPVRLVSFVADVCLMVQSILIIQAYKDSSVSPVDRISKRLYLAAIAGLVTALVDLVMVFADNTRAFRTFQMVHVYVVQVWNILLASWVIDTGKAYRRVYTFAWVSLVAWVIAAAFGIAWERQRYKDSKSFQAATFSDVRTFISREESV